MRQLDTRTLLGTLLVLAALGLPITAQGGDDPCKSTQAADELRSCGYCREVKRILSDPAMEGVTFEVTELRVGATVEMHAVSDDGRLLLQDLVDSMWGEPTVDGGEHVCDYCSKRRAKLAGVLVDWTSTPQGVEMVLISEDPMVAKWALADARATQGWVLSSAAD